MSNLGYERGTMSRRAFTRAAGFSLAGAVIGGPTLGAVHPLESFKPQETDTRGLSAKQQQDVQARWNNIMRKRGKRFTEKQKTRLRHILLNNERMMQSVREFSLPNGDTPASVLKLYAHPEE